MGSRLLTIAATFATLTAASTARSESVGAARATVGVGGEVTVDDGEPSDVQTSFGIEGVFIYGLHKNLGFGALLAYTSWVAESDQDVARNSFFDFALRPEFRFPVHAKVDVLAAIRFGATYSVLGEDEISFGGSNIATIDPALGYHFGGGVGARLWLAASTAVELEVAFSGHRAEHQVDSVFGDGKFEGDVSQLMIRLGVALGSRL